MNKTPQNTHSQLKNGTDWLVVAKPEHRMTAINELLDVITAPKNAVAPRRRAAFFTATLQ